MCWQIFKPTVQCKTCSLKTQFSNFIGFLYLASFSKYKITIINNFSQHRKRLVAVEHVMFLFDDLHESEFPRWHWQPNCLALTHTKMQRDQQHADIDRTLWEYLVSLELLKYCTCIPWNFYTTNNECMSISTRDELLALRSALNLGMHYNYL